MTRTFLIIAACIAQLASATVVYAQWAQPVRSVTDARAFCRYSAPVPEAPTPKTQQQAPSSDDATAEETVRSQRPKTSLAEFGEEVESYTNKRRAIARRPVTVWVDAKAAPVIGYDQLSGTLQFNLYDNVTFAEGYAVNVPLAAVAFLFAEERAQRYWARYEAGTARLKLSFFPAAWSEYDRPLCRPEGGQLVIDGEMLRAELVDEVGNELAAVETELGHEVAMMREHGIRGYLDAAMPVVAVSALTRFPEPEPELEKRSVYKVKSAIRSRLYGCYLRGLSKNARLQGAFVVKLVYGDDGDPGVLVDSLHDDATSACALERLSELARTDETFEAGTVLKATVIFRLDEAPSL